MPLTAGAEPARRSALPPSTYTQVRAAVKTLLHISFIIDAINRRTGRAVAWLVLVSVIISSANAIVRYLLSTSSNAWLELQWYLFSSIVLLCCGYTLLEDEHVRIDVFSSRMSGRVRAWIDLICGLLFLLPICVIVGTLSWPMFVDSFMRHERSGDAGGLLRWPVKLLVPVGFFLLAAQGVSEIVKRLAFLRGVAPDPAARRSGAEPPSAAGQ